MYIVKQKFDVTDLLPRQPTARQVLLLEPEYYTRGVYCRHLNEAGFVVLEADGLEEGSALVKIHGADAAVVNPSHELDEKIFLKRLQDFNYHHPQLPILTVGEKLPLKLLSAIMSLGVVGHLEKQLTRPRDIVTIINTVIYN